MGLRVPLGFPLKQIQNIGPANSPQASSQLVDGKYVTSEDTGGTGGIFDDF